MLIKAVQLLAKIFFKTNFFRNFLEEYISIKYSGDNNQEKKLVALNSFGLLSETRSWYFLGAHIAAVQAKCVGLKKITLIEFGVANGSGLLHLIRAAEYVNTITGIEFEIFGFDSAIGLPELNDYRDHPEIWSRGDFIMDDKEDLIKKLPSNCEIIIGKIEETLPPFIKEKLNVNSPIGFFSLDVDLYHSSRDCLKILEVESSLLLPTVVMYADDVHDLITYNKWCGEELAIKEFNEKHDFRKIQEKYTREMPYDYHRISPYKFYFCQILDHPVRNGLIKPKEKLDISLERFLMSFEQCFFH